MYYITQGIKLHRTAQNKVRPSYAEVCNFNKEIITYALAKKRWIGIYIHARMSPPEKFNFLITCQEKKGKCYIAFFSVAPEI